MKREKKKCSVSKVWMFIGGVALTVAGFIVIPPLMKKCSNKMYKSLLKKEEIDFDGMGPEIVAQDRTKGE